MRVCVSMQYMCVCVCNSREYRDIVIVGRDIVLLIGYAQWLSAWVGMGDGGWGGAVLTFWRSDV